jgi:hypothetical protein
VSRNRIRPYWLVRLHRRVARREFLAQIEAFEYLTEMSVEQAAKAMNGLKISRDIALSVPRTKDGLH